MNERFAGLLDRSSLFGLTILIQVTFISVAALCLCWALRRRPSASHFVALATVATLAFFPMLLFVSISRWCVIPVDLATAATRSAQSNNVEPLPDVPASNQESPREVVAMGRTTTQNQSTSQIASDDAPRSKEPLPANNDQNVQRVDQLTNDLATDTLQPTPRFDSTTRPTKQNKFPATPTVRDGVQAVVLTVDVATIVRQSLRLAIVGWMAGALLLMVRFGFHFWRLSCIVAKCEPATRPGLGDVMHRIVEELRLRQTPSVRTSDSLPMPIVTGVFRPKVILPRTLGQQWSEEELHIIMSHECAHIARRDLWVSLLQRMISIVYWPNIFVHILNRRLSRAREELCDNHVLAIASATAYAKTLLRLGEGATDSPALVTSLPWIGKNWSLEDRVSDLLDPKRRTETHVGRGIALFSLIAVIAIVVIAAGITISEKSQAEQRPLSISTHEKRDPAQLVKALAERAAYWTTPASPELKTLEYTYLLGHSPQEIVLNKRTSNVRYSEWQACSLRTGIHTLLRVPDRFTVETVEQGPEDILTITAKLSDVDEKNVGIEVGNGINGSWIGYYSHSTREVVLKVDKKRLVPLEEKSGSTNVQYSDWKEVSADRWVPGTIDVSNGQIRYRMHFEWAGNAVWLMTYGESISQDGAETIARTRDVKVNDVATIRELTVKEKSQQEKRAIVQRMLDKNQTWLSSNPIDLDSIEYTFHTVREDVREKGFLNRDGTAILEVIHDGQGKMGDQLGERQISLPTQEVAYTHRDARFAKLTPRPTPLKGQPVDEQYRHYARIGCQFDLPLFRCKERLQLAHLEIEDGEWKGRLCDVAQIQGLGRDIYLGVGTMFGFTSWSYLHHIRPVREFIFLDKQTHLPIHESFVGSEPKQSFEIDFDDYVEVSEGQWAPLSIRIESKDYFTAEYKFQVIHGKHWMLKEVVSWFDSAEKSQGVIEDVRVNEDSDLYKAAMNQIRASRTLFGNQSRIQHAPVDAVPIVFGKHTKVGSFQATLTVVGNGNAAIRIETINNETINKDALRDVPVLLLDEEQHLLFATKVKLVAEGQLLCGEAGLESSHVLGKIHSIVVPGASQTRGDQKAIADSEFSWNTPTSLNVSDIHEMNTRVYGLLLSREENGTASAKLSVASHKGPAEFLIDLSVVLFDENDQIIASGMRNATMLVKNGIVEKQFDIPLGLVTDAHKATKVAIAVTVGDVVSVPMGSTWGQTMRDGLAIPLELLLSADDESCLKQGLQQLNGKIRLDKEFFDDQRDHDRLFERGESRSKLLAPYVEYLAKIVQQTSDEVVLVEALRLLGHSGSRQHVSIAKEQLNHPSDQVIDAAAIATTMLGDSSRIDRLRSIFDRRVPSWDTERDEARSFDRLETDAVIALASVSDERAVRLLGEILQKDLYSLIPAIDDKGNKFLAGRSGRIKRVIQVLGYCENEVAAPVLVNAVKFFDNYSAIADIFDQLPLVEALLKYESATRDVISQQISKGNYAYIRAFKLNVTKNPYYVTAVHDMLLLPESNAWTAWQGVRYLWNVGNPAAVHVLRDAYDKQIHKNSLETRFAICEALASFGDDRGVVDAIEALIESYAMTIPPTEKAERKAWDQRRKDLEKGAKEILARVGQESLINLIQSKLGTDNALQRRVVVETLWYVSKTPASMLPVLQQWQDDADDSLSAEIAKLLKRE